MSEYEIIDTMTNLYGNFLQGQLAFFPSLPRTS